MTLARQGADLAGLCPFHAEDTPSLKHAAPYFRGQVAHALRLKFAPELTFQPDHALDYASRIDRLLHRPEVARDPE